MLHCGESIWAELIFIVQFSVLLIFRVIDYAKCVVVGEVHLCDKVVMLFGCVALILIYTKEDTALITQHRSVFLWV